MMQSFVLLAQRFMHWPLAGGMLLCVAAVLGMLAANTAAQQVYDDLLTTTAYIGVGEFGLRKPLLLWINDGLMAVFFFLVGLEIKREMVAGQLASLRAAALPVVAAAGGMAAPALVYLAINYGIPANTPGWAIPAATDIAFSLGVLTLLGNRVPIAAKIFLTAVAIVDDLGAIVIIALFYSGGLAMEALIVAGICLAVLAVLNRSGVRALLPYLLVGACMWVAVLQSGVHATLAGVALALFIPIGEPEKHRSPLDDAMHVLHPWVAFLILPVFAFANAGVDLSDVRLSAFAEPLTLGIALGLLVGKPVGIMGAVALSHMSGLARMPDELDWSRMLGISLLCGIGFTMSLFVGTLAFEGTEEAVRVRLGVLGGSLLSAIAGYAVLYVVGVKARRTADAASN